MEIGVELATLKENARALEIALKDNLKPIINDLRTNGLIKDGVFERVQDVKVCLTQEERSGELVRSIEDVVELSHENYYKFIRILSGKGVAHLYKDIVMKLHSTYCGKLCGFTDNYLHLLVTVCF